MISKFRVTNGSIKKIWLRKYCLTEGRDAGLQFKVQLNYIPHAPTHLSCYIKLWSVVSDFKHIQVVSLYFFRNFKCKRGIISCRYAQLHTK